MAVYKGKCAFQIVLHACDGVGINLWGVVYQFNAPVDNESSYCGVSYEEDVALLQRNFLATNVSCFSFRKEKLELDFGSLGGCANTAFGTIFADGNPGAGCSLQN